MAKFNAATAVESLDYDFTAYGGGEGVVPEPSTGAVNTFFNNMKILAKEVTALSELAKEVDVEGMTDEDLAKHMASIDEAQAGAEHYQRKTIENLAELCGGVREFEEIHTESAEEPVTKIETVVGGSPSVDDLSKLPYRVLQAFSQWLMGEIRPKKTTPGTKR